VLALLIVAVGCERMWRDMLKSLKFVSLVGVILAGCNPVFESKAPIRTVKATPLGNSSDEASQRILEPTDRLIGGIKFEIPAGWEEKSANSMILAEFSLQGESGPGRLTLSKMGGGIGLNMDRWKEQFRRGPKDPEPKESQITAAGKEATLIEVQGTYQGDSTGPGGQGGSKADWQLLGAAIPIESDYTYFVKFTGPRETVSAHRDEFLKFIESARFE